jgi:RNA polymerase sigma-70 factor (ECF subfamily)
MNNYSGYDDDQLLELLKSRDEAAFAEIYNRYAPKILYQINQMLREKEAAQDLVQELFITIWNKSANIRSGGNLSGYFYIAAQNSVLLYMRRGKFKSDYLTSLSSYHDEIADEIADEDDLEQMHKLIQREIAQLPPKMKVIFELSRRPDLSYKVIAQQLGIAENTVRKQVSNALHLIRGNVSKHGSSGLILIALLRP